MSDSPATPKQSLTADAGELNVNVVEALSLIRMVANSVGAMEMPFAARTLNSAAKTLEDHAKRALTAAKQPATDTGEAGSTKALEEIKAELEKKRETWLSEAREHERDAEISDARRCHNRALGISEALSVVLTALRSVAQQKPDVEELHAAHEAYEKLLVEELEEMIGLATVHGWKSSRHEAGKAARARIDAALSSSRAIDTGSKRD